MFEAIRTKTSTTVAASDVVRRAIVSGQYRPGAMLPSERELARQLGISRMTVRAALYPLQLAGILIARHGKGYEVLDPADAGDRTMLKSLVAVHAERGQGRSALAELLLMRRHLAAAALDALTQKHARDPQSITVVHKAIGAAIDRFEAAIDADDNGKIAEADLAIVKLILLAADSALLRLTVNPVLAIMQDNALLRDAMYANPRENLVGWRVFHTWLSKPSTAHVASLLTVLARQDAITVERFTENKFARRARLRAATTSLRRRRASREP